MDMSNTPERVAPFCPQSVTKTQRLMVLPSGFEIPEALAFAFRDQVRDRAPLLSRDRRYKLKQICGTEFWSLFSVGEVRLGGMYIAHLVSIGELPLEFATCPHAVPKRYRLK